MSRAKKATLADVARAAGVSITTASYVLNKTRTGFSEQTVDRVANAARELGFRPSALARGLRTGRTGLIGMLCDADMECALYAYGYQVEMGVALEAKKHGMDIVKVLISIETEPEMSRISDLLDTGLIEGVILPNPPRDSIVIPWLLERRAVFVVIGHPPQPEVHSVGNDNALVGRICAQHLIDLGHRKLAYIAPPEKLVFGNDRVRGFLDACVGAGLDGNDYTVVRVERSMAGGCEGMRSVLAMPRQVTGVCAADDRVACGAVAAITEAGLSVPRDISVVGCNNDPLVGSRGLRLTTVEPNFSGLGAMAAAKLVSLIEGQPVAIRDTGEVELVHGETSGLPRGLRGGGG